MSAGVQFGANIAKPGNVKGVDECCYALEEIAEKLRSDLTETEGALRQEVSDTIREERTQRMQADKTLNNQMEELSIGGLMIERIGLVWLAGGWWRLRYLVRWSR